MNIISNILKGYLNLIKTSSKAILTAIKIVLFLIFVLCLSICIVYPLWYMASESPSNYTFMVSIISILLVVLYIVNKAVATIKIKGFKSAVKEELLPKTKKILFYLSMILLALFAIYIYSFSSIVGLILTFIILTIFGYSKFAFKN